MGLKYLVYCHVIYHILLETRRDSRTDRQTGRQAGRQAKAFQSRQLHAGQKQVYRSFSLSFIHRLSAAACISCPGPAPARKKKEATIIHICRRYHPTTHTIHPLFSESQNTRFQRCQSNTPKCRVWGKKEKVYDLIRFIQPCQPNAAEEEPLHRKMMGAVRDFLYVIRQEENQEEVLDW